MQKIPLFCIAIGGSRPDLSGLSWTAVISCLRSQCFVSGAELTAGPQNPVIAL